MRRPCTYPSQTDRQKDRQISIESACTHALHYAVMPFHEQPTKPQPPTNQHRATDHITIPKQTNNTDHTTTPTQTTTDHYQPNQTTTNQCQPTNHATHTTQQSHEPISKLPTGNRGTPLGGRPYMINQPHHATLQKTTITTHITAGPLTGNATPHPNDADSTHYLVPMVQGYTATYIV